MLPIAYKEMFENEMDHPWYKSTRQLLVRTLEKYLSKNAKILDAGCGTGGTITYLQKAGFKNVQGVDSSNEALKYCRTRKIKNVQKSSILKLPYAANSFDCVICLDVLYHRGVDTKVALREFMRVLVNGGLLYSQEPAYNWMKSKHDLAIQTNSRFTAGAINNLLESCGFKKVKITYFNTLFFLPILLKRFKDRIAKKSKEKSDVHKMKGPLEKIYRQALSVEIKTLGITSLPFGLSIISIAKKP